MGAEPRRVGAGSWLGLQAVVDAEAPQENGRHRRKFDEKFSSLASIEIFFKRVISDTLAHFMTKFTQMGCNGYGGCRHY